MKRVVLSLLLLSSSSVAYATDSQCLANKYDAYIDASLNWYQELVSLTTNQYPELAEVGDWFYQGRQHHFELNRAVVHQYLEENQNKIATEQPIESWLDLKQSDIKRLASRNDALGKVAATSFQDRQTAPHPKNYELRSAFAELLSHPSKIESALNRYNQAIDKAESITCP